MSEKTEERKRFENRGFGIKAYAKAYNVSHATLSRVLDGTLDGSKSSKDGKVRVLMNQLKKDGVIRGKLSWEK